MLKIDKNKSTTYFQLMKNTFKLIRFTGHWFPTDDHLKNSRLHMILNFLRSFLFISTIPLQMIPCIIDLVLKIPDMPKVI